jgi:hypothetical protein
VAAQPAPPRSPARNDHEVGTETPGHSPSSSNLRDTAPTRAPNTSPIEACTELRESPNENGDDQDGHDKDLATAELQCSEHQLHSNGPRPTQRCQNRIRRQRRRPLSLSARRLVIAGPTRALSLDPSAAAPGRSEVSDQTNAGAGGERETDHDYLKLAYTEVHNRYAGITDFRAKLLGLLPLATGTGAIILLQRVQDPNSLHRPFLGPIGIFGLVVTVGLFIYELRGMQRCRNLEEQGEALEVAMNLDEKWGPFRGRPRRRLGGMFGAPAAGLIIYIATATAWLLLALYGFKASPNLRWALAGMGAFVLLLAVAWTLLWLCLNGAPTKASSSDRR